ncbi:hypothetical protein HGP16_25560 [Rhizobium sp. P40RR-XXII]|uniref:hypothetical protein n=1 Tax=Rhizobium sp. P40RR-XXII TaxID=2726739 RepID=UPI0014567662|nr:hypothetical protein [Rhizobium sp. P40RR-XXII]NLS19910.1 hypothetical protein [Rhizobium sp. P40RR-XXII]
MASDTKKFLQFIAAMLGLGLFGGLIIQANPPSSLALPIGLAWIVVFIGVIGFVIAGKQGTKDILSAMALMWVALIAGAAFIVWLVVAGAGHSL